MKHIPLTTLCVAISAVLLTACGGSGGSNPPAPTPIPNASGSGNTGNTGNAGGTDNTANAGNTGGTNSGTGSANTPEPKYQDVPTTPNNKEQVSGIQEPAMGYGIELKLRNRIGGQEEHAKISTDDVVKLEGGLEHKPFDNSIWQNIKNSKEVQHAYNQDKQHIEDQIRRDNKQRPDEEKLDEAALKARIEKALDDRLTELAKPIYERNINYSHDKQNKARTRDLTYVRSGYIYRSGYSNIDFSKQIAKTGFDGALFYKGEQTAKQLPVSEVKYKGTWDFMTDAKNKQSFSSFGARAGDHYSAMSSHEYPSLLTDEKNKPNDYNGEYGHSSEFTVNFKEKKLTGGLFSNLQDSHKGEVKKTKRYDINASIHGNRFRGSATASNKNDTSKHPFTSDANNRLEGGFYGPNAEELAGKFLTDDNKLFGVFGAKRESKAGEKTEAILDAYALGTFNTKEATTFTPFTKKQLDNFGNAKKLVLGSTVIDLVPTGAAKDVNEFKEKPKSATNKAGETLMVNDEVIVKTYGYGKNFEYLKFGELSVGTSNSVFLQGERTAEKAVPATGKAKYLGNWVGYITGTGTGTGTGKSFTDAQDVADFDIDFEKKTVNGKLITKDRKDPVFNITGQIAGNGWTGKASTAKANAGGYNIDSSSSTNKSIVIENANVTGGFYGPNANEMGGSFTHDTNDSKASVVFGTKKQEVKP
ncbi:transferrin-binding protein-like solute binding protein [Moraxella catarrhalis]|uniref:transferrin-binding protein-like solute binding protein n=1 Tax=Moraxella catarrhalis TaxID=480 RepID=UPI000EA9E3C6|nr:transferrin-binding protein-like solute binding protein [Moraxella catarrhalis]MPW81958.1 transferrin-binding protein-like solute binding protein [Moraxella catarrhalis]MPX37231.1 transferrin-binding protein-like solute binding protein [Moraxella catarrhalis]MPX62574.1 transferrin-binding protein-like solute binding protein [Moraxella catarrhalis]RKM21306.1 transferrin-binding protein-like solute binding protein [Moraxella catarrhalis]RKM23057.1 transferrin-binding protein-like solute bindi